MKMRKEEGVVEGVREKGEGGREKGECEGRREEGEGRSKGEG